VAQGVGPEFKPQYCKEKKGRKERKGRREEGNKIRKEGEREGGGKEGRKKKERTCFFSLL
jgi:hypothetical protein